MALRELTVEEIDFVSGGTVFMGTDLTGLSRPQMVNVINRILDNINRTLPWYALSGGINPINAEMIASQEDLDNLISDLHSRIQLGYEALGRDDSNSSEHDALDNMAQYYGQPFYTMPGAGSANYWAGIAQEEARIREMESYLTTIARMIYNGDGNGNVALTMHLFAGRLIDMGLGHLVSGYNGLGIYNGIDVFDFQRTATEISYIGDDYVQIDGRVYSIVEIEAGAAYFENIINVMEADPILSRILDEITADYFVGPAEYQRWLDAVAAFIARDRIDNPNRYIYNGPTPGDRGQPTSGGGSHNSGSNDNSSNNENFSQSSYY
jgi:hypothetical protein